MVIATDMANHNASLNILRHITDKIDVTSQGVNPNNMSNELDDLRKNSKVFLLGQALHIADITNPSRDWHVCQRWIDLVFREFFAQGDLERQMNMPISMLMDKQTTNIAVSQINFINFVVEPTLTIFGKLCRGVKQVDSNNQQEQPLIARVFENRERWRNLEDVFEQYRETTTASTNGVGGKFEISIDNEFFSYENYLKRKMARALKNG